MNNEGLPFYDPSNSSSYSILSDGKVSVTGNLPKYLNTSGLLLTDSGIAASAFNDYVRLDGSTPMQSSWNTGSFDLTLGNIYDDTDNTYDIGTTSVKRRKIYSNEVETPLITQPSADNNVVIGSGASTTANASNVLIGNGASIAAGQILSTVVGFGATANGNYCTNVGSQNNTGGGSIAVGAQVSANGANSIGIGNLTSVSNDNCVAIGFQASASELQGTAVGSSAICSGGQYGCAYGTASTASAAQAIAIGVLSVASQSDAIAIGSFCDNNIADSCKIGSTSITNIRANSLVCDLGTVTEPFQNAYLSGSLIGSVKTSATNDLVTNASTSVSGNVPSFSGTSGKIITDSLMPVRNLVSQKCAQTAQYNAIFNVTTETSIIPSSVTGNLAFAANSTVNGTTIKLKSVWLSEFGVVTTLTLRFKVNGTTIYTITSTPGILSNNIVTHEWNAQMRGTSDILISSQLCYDGIAAQNRQSYIAGWDKTISNTISVTGQFSDTNGIIVVTLFESTLAN